MLKLFSNYVLLFFLEGFPGSSVVKNLPASAGDASSVWVGKIPWRRIWQPTPVFLPGESHGQRSLVDYSSYGLKESDTSEGDKFYPNPEPNL